MKCFFIVGDEIGNLKFKEIIIRFYIFVLINLKAMQPFFTIQQESTLKKKWILIAVYFILAAILFSNSYFHFIQSRGAKNFLLFGLNAFIWSYFFCVNKYWKQAFLIFFFGLIYFVFSDGIQDDLDYLIGSSLIKNSSVIRSSANIIITLAYYFSICYANISVLKNTTKKQKLFIVLVTMACVWGVENISLDGSDLLVDTLSINHFLVVIILTIIYTIKDISFWIAHLYLLNKIKTNHSLFEKQSELEYPRKTFLVFFFIGYSVLFSLLIQLTIGSLFIRFQSIFSFASNIKFDVIINLFQTLLFAGLFWVVSLAVGNMLYKKANDEGKYYGVAGFSLILPLLNLPAYFIIGYGKLKEFLKLRIEKFGKQKRLHTLFSILLITIIHLYIDRKQLAEINTYIALAVYVVLILLTALTSLRPLLLAFIALFLFIIKGSLSWGAGSFFHDLFEDLKDIFSVGGGIAFISKLSVAYGIFYILKNVLTRRVNVWKVSESEENIVPAQEV